MPIPTDPHSYSPLASTGYAYPGRRCKVPTRIRPCVNVRVRPGHECEIPVLDRNEHKTGRMIGCKLRILPGT
eukprot:gene654-11969_t